MRAQSQIARLVQQHSKYTHTRVISSPKPFPFPTKHFSSRASMAFQNIGHSLAVERYTEKHLIRPQKGLAHARTNTAKHGIPSIALSAVQGKFVSLLAAMSGAKNVLEIGTLGGYSSIWLSQALQRSGGKLTSIEVSSKHRKVAIENLRHAGVKVPEEADVLLGAGLEVLPRLEEEIERGERERFDFVFIDADWENQWAYFDYGVRLSNGTGSVVYVDNVVMEILSSGFLWPKEMDRDAISVVERAGKDERVDAVVMQTVGSRDYDGFLMAVVR